MRLQLTPNAHQSYKIGVDEVQGLKQAMIEVLQPVQALIKSKVYWSDVEIESSEYKHRDGFIPHSDNLGGLGITLVIPSVEQYSFGFLEFGECDECGNAEEYPEGDHMCGYQGIECGAESEGHLDAKLRIWLKLEGVDLETGELTFWLYCGGGNVDAPYFRTKYEADIFEAEFTCKSVAGLQKAAAKHIKALIKVME